MKKSFLLISLAALMFLFSCKKDEETNPFNVDYTQETVEQSKANVEQNAVDMVGQLDGLASAQGIKVLLHLNELQSTQPVKSLPEGTFLEPLSMISTLGDKSNINKVFEGMKGASAQFEEDPLAVSALFDSIAGRYTYNFETGEFDKSELADKVVIEFPGMEGDLTNTAVITVDNFTVAEISNPIEQWPSGLAPELPASIKIALTYNGLDLAGASFDATYKSDGMPTSVKVELYVDDFTLTMKVVHDPYSSASYTTTLKLKDDILFEVYLAAEGDWSAENIDASIEEVQYTDDNGTWTDTQTHIEEIINNANAHVILMNLKVLGKVNVKVLGDTIWSLDERRDLISEEQYTQAAADAINANAELIVIYRDSNTKIAEAEAYVESYFDDYSQEYEYYVAMRFVYADGSKVDVETYVNDELDNFYTAMNDFIDKLNTEYDLNLNYIGPAK